MKGTSTRPGKNDSGKASEGYSYYAEREKMAYKIVFDEKILSSLKINSSFIDQEIKEDSL